MSWNPRRFAAGLPGRGYVRPDAELLWLTAEASARICDMLSRGDSARTAIPLPAKGFAVGLQTPIAFKGSEVSVIAGAAVRDLGATEWTKRGGLVGPGYRILLAARNFTSHHLMLMPRDPFAPTATGVTDALRDPEASGLAVFIMAAWALRHEPEEMERVATTAALQRVSPGKGRRRRDQDIAVIDVRRPPVVHGSAAGGGSDRAIEHDHRWPVQGHWRSQPCGPGGALRRPTYIEAHIKGPPDKPLRASRKVYRLH